MEFLAWLDVIPGRHWLVVGSHQDAGMLGEAIAADYKPSAVTTFELPEDEGLPFAHGTFDVAVASSSAAPSVGLLQEMRRVIFPSGTVGLCGLLATAQGLELLLHQAGLHAVQSRRLMSGAIAVRGAR